MAVFISEPRSSDLHADIEEYVKFCPCAKIWTPTQWAGYCRYLTFDRIFSINDSHHLPASLTHASFIRSTSQSPVHQVARVILERLLRARRCVPGRQGHDAPACEERIQVQVMKKLFTRAVGFGIMNGMSQGSDAKPSVSLPGPYSHPRVYVRVGSS